MYTFKNIGDEFDFLQKSKLQRISKLHNWFKRYGDFSEGLEFSYWWFCIGLGRVCAQPAKQACSNNLVAFMFSKRPSSPVQLSTDVSCVCSSKRLQ